ncbi:kinase-like protein [Artomyces pyxidatus]|uniref:Kinase-like protein n=1 Tax=Artomyces pyxidatus TaxID=48021 RepID=A0ACB8SJT0_9AGAM|nr:kinase-like protein [Artomyces pyxidatus]
MELDCLAITHEKKYYCVEGSHGNCYVKRSVTRDEWITNWKGEIVDPRMPMERLKNEVAAINFVRTHTNIPIPTVRAAFEDRGCYYIITDEVPGVSLSQLPDAQKAMVIEEIERHLAVLRGITSTTMGGFCGAACVPYRLAMALSPGELAALTFKEDVPHELVLCHNDLGQHNVLVDEETLKITAIIDWEYAGFYPREFEAAFFKRRGPSAALKGEEDDVPRLLTLLDDCVQKESASAGV